MPVPAMLPGLFPTELLRDNAATALTPGAALKQPARDSAAPGAPMPDVVVFSSAPFRILADLATAGLQRLATLLPAMEQAIEESSTVPLGHLAKVAGAAARQVAEGHVAVLAAGPDRIAAALPGPLPARAAPPSPALQLLRSIAREIGAAPATTPETTAEAPPETTADRRTSDALRTAARQLGAGIADPADRLIDDPKTDPAQRWLTEAKQVLQRTGEVLGQAETIVAAADPKVQPAPDWIALEIAAAQTQIAMAVGRLATASPPPRRAMARASFSLALPGQLSGATSLVGLLVLLTMLGLAAGLWWLVMGLVAVAATAYAAWRIGRAARGLTLDAAR